ncbi:MAG TPA: type IV pilus modification protein PilV [Steroidobacter sp.]
MRSPPNTQRPLRRARHAGMTLIEVLVTLVIISVGLLGVAALQITTVRNNQDAYVRSQAAMLASDMLDRMRANRTDTAGNSKAVGYVVPIGDNDVPNTPEGAEVRSWRRVLAAQLPDGRGGIAYDAPTNLVTVTIQWGERAGRAADRTLTFVTNSTI